MGNARFVLHQPVGRFHDTGMNCRQSAHSLTATKAIHRPAWTSPGTTTVSVDAEGNRSKSGSRGEFISREATAHSHSVQSSKGSRIESGEHAAHVWLEQIQPGR